MEMARVMANSRKSLPTTSRMKSSGISTAIREMVRDTMVKAISPEPFKAAASGFSPLSMWREMFSIITIASSTTNPEAMVSAISERLSRLNPARYITAKVPIRDTGTDRLGMIVAGTLRRKRKITITTSATASDSSNCTSFTDARMVFVRSVTTERRTLEGSDARSRGKSACTRSTTWITFAPGWRCTLTSTAGASFTQLASWVFSALSSTRATSLRYTGAPSLYATTRFAYSAGLRI